jgi:hypothetical protein
LILFFSADASCYGSFRASGGNRCLFHTSKPVPAQNHGTLLADEEY